MWRAVSCLQGLCPFLTAVSPSPPTTTLPAAQSHRPGPYLAPGCWCLCLSLGPSQGRCPDHLVAVIHLEVITGSSGSGREEGTEEAWAPVLSAAGTPSSALSRGRAPSPCRAIPGTDCSAILQSCLQKRLVASGVGEGPGRGTRGRCPS